MYSVMLRIDTSLTVGTISFPFAGNSNVEAEKSPFLEKSEPVRLTPAWEENNLPNDELNFKGKLVLRQIEQELHKGSCYDESAAAKTLAPVAFVLYLISFPVPKIYVCCIPSLHSGHWNAYKRVFVFLFLLVLFYHAIYIDIYRMA